jgi:arginine decarboxylase
VENLYDKLKELKNQDMYPMHMPGHKRNTAICQMDNPYAYDITEIPGFDNLHQPEGLLLSLSQRLSCLYGSGRAYPLVNGSTAGILAGISSAVKRGDKVLLARNVHKSVYHAIILMGLAPIYCYPQIAEEMTFYGGILPNEIEEALISNPDIRLVVITSPTYEGVVSDIRLISEITHRYGALLLVDEAHGAHFGFSEGFPESAVKQGADLVIQSLHKTLPAFTQSAVLHCNNSDLENRIAKYLAVYESSSPSYLLLAGIENCVRMLEEKARELFIAYNKRLNGFYESVQSLKRLKLLSQDIIGKSGIYALDRSKLIIYDKEKRLSGHQLHEILRRRYHIVMEMEAMDYVLGMTSICDTDEGFERLERALSEMDYELENVGGITEITEETRMNQAKESFILRQSKADTAAPPVQAMLPQEAWNLPVEEIEFRKSYGRISAAFVSLFPPGTPLLVPGEVIDHGLIDYIEQVKGEEISVTGLIGENMDRIEVIASL